MEGWVWKLWLGFSIVLLMCEALTPGFFAACFAIAAGAAAGAAFFRLDTETQLGVFAAVGVASMFCIRPFFMKFLSKEDLKSNADALVGRECVSVGEHYAVLDGQKWRVTGGPYEAGTKLVVDAVGGAVLKVRKKEEII